MPEPWWKSAVVYQIYPRSFCDTTGSGVGDLDGIRGHLDHVAGLGVDAIWLSPIYPSPMVDHGYDVADYCGVDPMFGTLEIFDALVAESHERNLRVLLDWVPNHTSDAHPWFVASRSSRDDPKRDWYWWVDGTPDEPPNNWTAAFPEGSAWTWDETTEAWYLHLFTPQQPDLNWRNPEVRAAMHDTLRFWLDRGVDGFRMDVIHALGKDESLPDVGMRSIWAGAVLDEDLTHSYLRDIRRTLDSYDGERVAVGEVYILDTYTVADYYGTVDVPELHLSFNFLPIWQPWEPSNWRAQIGHAERAMGRDGTWPTWVLSNHDVVRHRTRFGGGEDRARAAAVMLLGLRGTPFLYAGEELGLEDADVPEEMREDPSGRRDGCRAPVPWEPAFPHGWASEDTWLPFPPEADRRNPEALAGEPDSILALYRRLLAARASSPALSLGALELIDDLPEEVVGWRRSRDGEERVVLLNMGDVPVRVEGLEERMVSVATSLAREGRDFDGRLAPAEAVILH